MCNNYILFSIKNRTAIKILLGKPYFIIHLLLLSAYKINFIRLKTENYKFRSFVVSYMNVTTFILR